MKKIYWIILIVLASLGLIILGIFLYTQHAKAKLSERHQNLLEVPSGVDYKNIDKTQAKKVLETAAKKFPNIETGKDKNGKTYAVPQIIVITEDGKVIDDGQTPMQGDVKIDSTSGSGSGGNNQNNQDNNQNQVTTTTTAITQTTAATSTTTTTPPPPPPPAPALQMPTIMYSGLVYPDTDQADLINKLKAIKAMAEKSYPEIVKIYGEPYDVKNRTISIIYDKEYKFSGYFPQYDTVYVNGTDAISVLPDFIGSFPGIKASGYPETWYYGSIYDAFMIVAQKFPEDAWQGAWIRAFIYKNYEKMNVPDYPIWGTNLTYPNDIFGPGSAWTRVVQASAALDKAYLSDNNFFANLNQQMYQIDFTTWYQQHDTEQLFDKVSSAFPSIEGKTAQVWYKGQHVLHQTETNTARLLNMIHVGQTLAIVLNYDDPNLDVIQVFDYKSTLGFTPKSSRAISVAIANDKNETVVNQSYTTDNKGVIQKKLNEIGITASGRYLVHLNNDDTYFNFNYFSTGSTERLNGVVANFGQGKIVAYDQNNNLLEEVAISNGAFQFTKVLSGLLNLKIKDYSGNVALERLLILNAGAYYAYLASPTPSYPNQGQTRGSNANCQIDTASWQSYDGGEYTIKYPKDWFNNQESSQEGSAHWFVSFGPKDLAPLVYVGGNASDVNQFKTELTAVSGQGFQIKKEEKETVSGAEATKLTVEGGHNYPYLTYIYYIPLGNVPAVIKGPAKSDHFANSCEPEIFAEMIKNYNFRGMGPGSGAGNNPNNQAGNQTYTDSACGFSLEYPSDWKISENYYYETAGGEKANVPTIVLTKKDNKDASKNMITINPRQSSCVETAGSKKSKEVFLPNSSFVGNLVSYPDQNTTCEEATRDGKDKNGKNAEYHFYSVYDNNSGIKDIFKQIFLSFTVKD